MKTINPIGSYLGTKLKNKKGKKYVHTDFVWPDELWSIKKTFSIYLFNWKIDIYLNKKV